ncbi:efflux RND transporter periplasmic adaptor subunit [Thermogutta sp.]|uniref:efflux RND transporter periplasmic adaptor subunit n=1 Tax=Thermogutta sp. TaxID=1962930 RepID=UPI00321F92D7
MSEFRPFADPQDASVPGEVKAHDEASVSVPRKPGRAFFGRRRGWLIAVSIVAAFGVGWGAAQLMRHQASGGHTESERNQVQGEQKIKWWTCAMHPQVRQPGPGKCPICFMDLIPVYSEEETPLTIRQIRMTREAVALAEVETAPVRRIFPTREIRLWGRIDFDETRLATISARFPGRLDRLYVDYTGVPVRLGDHLVDIYSPELVVAQQELLQAQMSLKSATPGSTQYTVASSLLRSSEEKLRLWGILPDQIEEIKQRGFATDHVTLYAPIAGIVINKHAKEGDYVKTGDPIYSIADLSQVWAVFDGYEADIPWLRYGQTVVFETDAFPGEKFSGQIAFIDPTLREATRTIRVRVNVANPGVRLKPGMLARGLVEAHLAAEDTVFEPSLAGKWICPMHPEVISDSPGKCTRCGMDLVRVESLGYVAMDEKLTPPLVIPASAPLITGKRALVYVRVPDGEEPIFESRDIVLGPRVKEGYIVHSGLKEGELVVVKGNFKVDSAVQLTGKASMMHSVDQTSEVTTTKGPEFGSAGNPVLARALQSLWSPYLSIQRALSHDEPGEAVAGFAAIEATLPQLLRADLPEKERQQLAEIVPHLQAACDQARNMQDMEVLRSAFRHLSQSLIEAVKQFGHAHEKPLVVVYCPMAFSNQGAEWLQEGEEVANPYFGSRMLRCGEVKERIEPLGTKGDVNPSTRGGSQPQPPMNHFHQH